MPSRVWFLSRGCKQVPLEYTKNIVRWGHPDGYFLNAQGQKVMDNFCPAMQRGFTPENPSAGGFTGSCYPIDRTTGVNCHILMALAFYGERPIDPTTGKPCVCHHLINDKLDYRPANLLCWLTREQHNEADRRQRALLKVIGDLHKWSYKKLRKYQDPRVMTREVFDNFIERKTKKKEADNAKDNL